MITVIYNKINSFNQTSYNKFLEDIDLNQLSCSCGLSATLIKHAYYKRSIKTTDGIVTLFILRLKCKHCSKTHALFPQCIIPFSQILLHEHISIIKAFINKSSFEPIMTANIYIDESNINYIIRQYLQHWKQRIYAYCLSIEDEISNFSKQCLLIFKRQFMQIKCITNILCAQTHIT